MTIITPNEIDQSHLEEVMNEMGELGAPTIKAFWTGELWRALEGSHRIHAAAELGLAVVIEPMSEEDEMDHDFDQVDGNTVAEILEYLGFDGEYVECDVED